MHLPSSSLMRVLTRLRDRLVPEALGLGWMPLLLLGYLLFLFVPVLVPSNADWGEGVRWYLWPTLVSIAVFLPMYFLAYRGSAMTRVLCTLGIAALGYGLMPFNAFSNTYVIYAAAFAALLPGSMWTRLGALALLLAAYCAMAAWLVFPAFVPAVTAIVSVAVFSGNYFQAETVRKRAELKLSHDEVRRLAALAERERIGRDLHDLLGHTLSLVALKSDLAGRLIERDPQAARNEIIEVSRVARDALAQVRRAVTGIRAAGLAAELASAKLLLESDGVTLRYEAREVVVPPDLETVLALALREAVTNIQRHARATLAEVILASTADHVQLRIRDNGVGSATVPGNGLTGMRERVESRGGRLRIDSTLRQGTCVEITLPLPSADGAEAPDEQHVVKRSVGAT
ncbi:sensor histidine kinase [Pseudoxanthomonas sp. SL93]|uniref:sensor histidine kinase n=1 Tax=Pseudoxanthomonas sp. SL93 TaxID=2995142 RepID=UPI00226E0541|nr:sensor histidine kinase [Pseudoxanthomonas sp. SL93]WAC62016.1 sensor histidine kinase [Pseudoxanthomonas sp. SL93]